MRICLSIQNEKLHTLRMTVGAWFDMLALAEQYGWNPMGTVPPNWAMHSAGFFGDDGHSWEESGAGSYTSEASSLVLFEDALNLADALEQAFIEYDPHPSSQYLPGYSNDWGENYDGLRAGIGVVLELTEFCRHGAFRVDPE